MDITTIRALVKDELADVDTLIANQLGTDIELIKSLGQHIFGSGGKRIRPLLVLLSAKALNYQETKHIDIAAIIELIHTATLLHDDVVDYSNLRRGKKTANFIWGNSASVLVGDYLYSRSFQMMVNLIDFAILRVLANASNVIAEGEVLQLLQQQDLSTTEAQYREIIYRKTAMLFQAATESAAIVSGAEQNIVQALANYGKHLGMAFQLIDDALDYGISSEDLGKTIGNDLAEGKLTLPLIHALNHAKAEEKNIILEAIRLAKEKQNNHHLLDSICKIITSTQAIAYTYSAAYSEADMAITHIETIPHSPYQQALKELALFAVERKV